MKVRMEETTAMAEEPAAVAVEAGSVPTPAIEKSPYVQLQESRTSVEQIVAKMLSIRKEGKSKAELGELVAQMFLQFVTLRQINRSIFLEEDRVKAETERAKAPLDFTTLQLHNLMYEKNHYVKAIKACRDFKSKYPDIELVPEEVYFRDASEDIKGTIMSNDSAHNLMLKRLNYELFQRKELCKLREKLEQHKKSLLETISNRKKFLSSLPSHLKSLKKASLPVQHQLGVLHTKRLKQHNSAELLPPPLYVMYSQFMAQKDAFGESIDLDIVGSVKDAQAFARQQATKDTVVGMPAYAESLRLEDDAPDEDDDGQRRRKRPKKVPGKENPEQSGIYQAHPLKIILHVYDDEISDIDPGKLVTLKFEYLLKLNVACVSVEGSDDIPENNILCNLFPDDTGLELPHQSAKVFLGDDLAFHEKSISRPYKWVQHLAGIDFLPEVSPLLMGSDTPSNDVSRSSAVISGLSLYRQQNRAQTVVQRIRSRIKSQKALAEQLQSLVALKWPCLACESVPWASHAPACILHGWSPVNQDESLTVVDAEPVPDPVPVDMDGASSTSKEEMEGVREDGELPSLVPADVSNLEHSREMILISKSNAAPIMKSLSFRKAVEDLDMMLDGESDDVDEGMDVTDEQCGVDEKAWVDYGSREFRLVLTRKERRVELDAKVRISMEYPLRPPLFVVSLLGDVSEWCNEARAMEAVVNIYMVKMVGGEQEEVMLGHQIRCLAMLFDLYVDDMVDFEPRKRSCVVDVGLGKPVSGTLVARSFRGRDRRKMLSWKDAQCTPGFPC